MNDGFQFFDIILFAMIAAFLVLRLRSVLGRRDGHESKHRNPFLPPEPDKDENNVIPLSDQNQQETGTEIPETEERPRDPLAAGLLDIRKADPRFDRKDFESGARFAFELILNAYAAGDTKTLKPLLSPEVFGNFSRSIGDRERAGEILEDTLVGITSVEVVEAYMEGNNAFLTTKFVSDQINASRDENGDVVDGNPNAVIQVTDFWTFSRNIRARDPNWTLVATRSLE